jgi:hypothetical protein
VDVGRFRQHIVDALHRGQALLGHVHHPAQRDHGPHQHHQISVEGDERTQRDLLSDHLATAEIQNREHAQAGHGGKQRLQQALHLEELHVLFDVVLAQRFEFVRFIFLARVLLSPRECRSSFPAHAR